MALNFVACGVLQNVSSDFPAQLLLMLPITIKAIVPKIVMAEMTIPRTAKTTLRCLCRKPLIPSPSAIELLHDQSQQEESDNNRGG
jgi:hypothetical protein